MNTNTKPALWGKVQDKVPRWGWGRAVSSDWVRSLRTVSSKCPQSPQRRTLHRTFKDETDLISREGGETVRDGGRGSGRCKIVGQDLTVLFEGVMGILVDQGLRGRQVRK